MYVCMHACMYVRDYDLKSFSQLQGYIRGYLLRKKFRKVVHDYVNSPQADSRRQRNKVSLVTSSSYIMMYTWHYD